MAVDNRTRRFLDQLIAQLNGVYDDMLKLFEQVTLISREVERAGDKVKETVLEPSPQQQAASIAIYNRFNAWQETVSAFLARHSPEIEEQFSEISALFYTYILFQRVGTNISEDLWRTLFIRESRGIVAALVGAVHTTEEAFAILKPRIRLNYTEFTLKLRRLDGKKYEVEARSELGEIENNFTLPFDERDVENFVLKYCQPRRIPTRGWTPQSLRPLAEFGQQIFDSVLTGGVRDLFFRTRQHSESNQLGLRVKLRLNSTPELSNVPWEFMFDGKDFLGLSNSTPIIRHLDSSVPARPLKLKPPFRLLVTVSSPKDWIELDVEAEKKHLQIALAPLIALGILRVDFAPNGSLRTLQRMLRTAEISGEPYHIWHYIGHGKYDESEKASFFAFENEGRTQNLISGFELGTLFSSYASLRLAVLNACEGARTSREDPLSGVAVALVERGMPTVIAMQFEIADKTAALFAEEFYMALVDGLPVDAALTEARRAIFFVPNYTEWATPVLFMRVQDGVIFDIESTIDESMNQSTL